MRHLRRVHVVSVASLSELARRPDVNMVCEDTSRMVADIITKGFTDPRRGSHALSLINHFRGAAE
eukprot:100657-Lingulodinium_polyedra.AAC.1